MIVCRRHKRKACCPTVNSTTLRVAWQVALCKAQRRTSISVLLSHLGRRMPFWDRSLDLVVLTHPEADHVGGLVGMLERYQVGLVLDSGEECTNATCERWRALIEEGGIPYRRAEAAMGVTVCGAVLLDVLHPPARMMSGTSSDTNNNSVVLLLQYDQFSALLTGDVMEEAERVLHLSGQPLHSLALKVPHHGGDTSLSTSFLEAIGPELAIISVGADNRFGHPHEPTLEKLDGLPVYRTDLHGNIELVTDGARYWVRTGR